MYLYNWPGFLESPFTFNWVSSSYLLEQNEADYSKEKVKLRMRLRGTQAKMEAFSVRYKEAVEELNFMNRKYEDAAAKLKSQLAAYGMEILNLKKQLAAVTGWWHDLYRVYVIVFFSFLLIMQIHSGLLLEISRYKMKMEVVFAIQAHCYGPWC